MLPGAWPEAVSPTHTGWPPLGSLSTRREQSAAPPRGEGQGHCHQCWGLLEHVPWPTLSSLANTQMQESRRPGTPKVSAPPPPWPSTPKRLRQGGWGGRLGVGEQGSAVWSAGRQHKAQIFFSGTVSTWGLGLPPDTQASYFFPVRWMCWKRVIEKAMPRICMIRMHIPTVPSTCLLSSNHIFTFS